MILLQRRAQFIYDAARLAAMAAWAPIIPALWEEREITFTTQFLEIIDRQCSLQRSYSPEELHQTWMEAYVKMGWVYGETYNREKNTHPDLVPYAELGQLERDKDEVFMALCDIARQYIFDADENEWQRMERERGLPSDGEIEAGDNYR